MAKQYAGLSRRRFLAGAVGAGGVGVLIACGNQVSQVQSGPYATNAARNAPTANAAANTVNASTPAVSGSSAVATMDHTNATQSAGSAPAGTATPAKDWKAMNLHHEEGVKTFLAQPKTVRSAPMPFTMQDGIKVFDVSAKKVQWEVTPGQMVEAYTYNGVVPGPEIRVTEGDKVRIRLKNDLGDEPTAIHFHGLYIPNPMDGVPFITQPPVNPGEMFSYDFVARNPGSHMYHSHHNSAFQVTKGLLGALIIEPKDKSQYPAFDKEYTMILGDGPLGYTLNGKGFPGTEVVTANKGEKLLVRFMNEGLMIHPMHLHGMPMTIVAQDGWVNPPYKCDTVNVAPGQRIDAIVECTEVGAWAFHCHILSHAESEMGMFGMVTALVVK